MNLGTHTLKPDQSQRPALEDGCYPVGFSTAWPHGLGYSRRIRRSCAGSLGLKLERALVPVEGCPAVPSPSAEALCGADWTQTFQRGQHPPLRPEARLCPLSLGGSVGGVQAPYPESWGEGRTGWSKLATPRKGRTGDTEEPRGQPVALEVAWIRAETSRNETAATGAQRRGPGLRLGGAWWEGAPKDKDSAAGDKVSGHGGRHGAGQVQVLQPGPGSSRQLSSFPRGAPLLKHSPAQVGMPVCPVTAHMQSQ